MTSLTTRYRRIVKEAIDKPLKTKGFAKRGRVHTLWFPRLCWVIDVQRDWANTSVNCEFTLNIGIGVPGFTQIIYPNTELNRITDTSDCIVKMRFRHIVPSLTKDTWWVLNPENEDQDGEVVREIHNYLESFILPFFSRFKDRKDIIEYLEWLKSIRDEQGKGHQIWPNEPWLPIYLGILYCIEGDRGIGVGILREVHRVAVENSWVNTERIQEIMQDIDNRVELFHKHFQEVRALSAP